MINSINQVLDYVDDKAAIEDVQSFIVNARLFSNAIRVLNNIVSQTHPLEIVQNLHIVLKPPYLILTATDLKITVKLTIPVESKDNKPLNEIALCVPVSKLNPLSGLFKSSEDLIIAMDSKNKISFRYGSKGDKRRVVLNTHPDEYWPETQIDDMIDKPILTIKTSDLIDWIKRANVSAAKDYKILAGCLLHIEDQQWLSIVTTDSYKLSAVRRQKIQAEKLTQEMHCIIPANDLTSAIAVLDNFSDNDCQLIFCEQSLQINSGETQIHIQKMEGVYPAYQKTFQYPVGTTARVSVDDWLSAVKQAEIFNDSVDIDLVNHGLKVNQQAQEIMYVSSLDSQQGSSTDGINVDSMTGKDVSVVLSTIDIRYFLSLLSGLSDKVDITFSGDNLPVTLIPVSCPEMILILMPKVDKTQRQLKN